MAETQDTAAAAAPEPSMEEILASIRKIIADEPPPANGAASEEALELTQMVQEDGSVVDLKSAQSQAAASPPPPPPPPPPLTQNSSAPPKAPASDSKLVSDPAAQAAVSSLSSLANTVQIERLASAAQSSTFIGNGMRTLEDMVTELMKPMLKEWLDKNLPNIVDNLVQKEIERISRKAKD